MAGNLNLYFITCAFPVDYFRMSFDLCRPESLRKELQKPVLFLTHSNSPLGSSKFIPYAKPWELYDSSLHPVNLR